MPDALGEAKLILDEFYVEYGFSFAEIRKYIHELLEHIYDKLPTKDYREIFLTLYETCTKIIIKSEDMSKEDKYHITLPLCSICGIIMMFLTPPERFDKYKEMAFHVLKGLVDEQIKLVRLGKAADIHYKWEDK